MTVRAPFAALVGLGVALVATSSFGEAHAGAGSGEKLDCAKLPCAAVLPGALRFVSPKGPGPYLVGLDRKGKVVGWVALSTHIVDTKGYSGKPLVTLVGVGADSTISGAKVVHHSEPILLVGIPESALTRFVAFYKGKPLAAKIAVGASPDPKALTVDAISGATVTVLAENRTILDTAHAVGEAVGVLAVDATVPGHFVHEKESWSWARMVKEGVFGRVTVSQAQMGASGRGAFIDLHFAIIDSPQVGRALLGEREYAWQRRRLRPGEHLLVVLGNGSSSFKGSGFVRGGIFDRVRLEQGLRTVMFTDRDYANPALQLQDGPLFKESAVFTIRAGKLDPARRFDLVFLGSRYDRKGGFSREFHAFRGTLRLPSSVYALDGPDPEQSPAVAAWYRARWRLAALGALLLGLSGLFFGRRFLTARIRRLGWIHIGFMAVATLVIGFWLRAQPSITQVLTAVGSAVGEWRWELFLSEPLIFVFWIFIALVTISWGRGVFCGWACPYGALTELLFKLGRWLRIPSYELPPSLDRPLRFVKYVVLAVLVVSYLYSAQMGEVLAEIEPFKSTFFVAPWSRQALFVGWWLVLLIAAVFSWRPFCRYLCPLGAALAIPGSLRFSGPRRRKFCSSCQICARGCEPGAIRPDGTIDPRECLSCMECEAVYRDEGACPPLVGLGKLKALQAQNGTLDAAQLERKRRLDEQAGPR